MVEQICAFGAQLNSKNMNLVAHESIKVIHSLRRDISTNRRITTALPPPPLSQKIEQVNHGLGQIIEVQHELELGLEFYKVLFNAITDLDFEINDYLTSRIK